jgi:hypothetical protein
MSTFSIKFVAAAVLACFTLVTTADVNACCHHRRRCGGGGCGGGSCGYGGGGGYGGGCGGGYCYSGYGSGGYYTAMPAPRFPRLAYALRGRPVAPPVAMSAAPIVMTASAPSVVVAPTEPATQNLVLAGAGTANATVYDGGGNQ